MPALAGIFIEPIYREIRLQSWRLASEDLLDWYVQPEYPNAVLSWHYQLPSERLQGYRWR